MPRVIAYFVQNPRRLFLLDCGGALLTACCLGVVASAFPKLFGMPRPALLGLAALGCLYAAFSGSCAYVVGGRWRLFLLIIVLGNLLYFALLLGLSAWYYHWLTTLGVSYFLAEALVVLTLVVVEGWVLVTSAPGKDR
ncbi:hypothetical protein [Hymenobacter sp. BT190]|uniref:hypothetical protein n=1 Tax=Hymenobacter sp. BT190 TaxID=2763505 RepID=UPI00165132B7|nr:hypothetical protein [Hymenobacter sp. BT190]MBC6696959.1 hypothetical protein [Hymenobacter sp. BT190]